MTKPINTTAKYIEEKTTNKNIKIKDPVPVYYVQGTVAAKFQIGFNYQLIDDYKLYFTYQQFMVWDSYGYSLPILDFEINPKLHCYYEKTFGIIDPIDIDLWEHNSNGTNDDTSRSYDRSYLRFFKLLLWYI